MTRPVQVGRADEEEEGFYKILPVNTADHLSAWLPTLIGILCDDIR